MNHRIRVLLFTGFLVLLQLVNVENVSAQTNSQEKPTVGVIDLELTGQIDISARVPLSDELRKELFKTNKFNVLERNSMAEILNEQKFQRTDACSDTACIVEMGRVLGAQKMVAGSLGKVGNTYLLNVRLIDVGTGSIEQIGDDSCKCELDDLIGSIKTVAKKLAQLPVEDRTRTQVEKKQPIPQIDYQQLWSAHKYTGVKKCKMCHLAQYKIWETWKMAKTVDTLKAENNKKTNKDETQNPECLRCHTTGMGHGGYEVGKADPYLANVQCEACHGPGSDYMKMDVMKDKTKAIAAGLVIPDEKVCKTCHTPEWSPNFDYAEYVNQIYHKSQR